MMAISNRFSRRRQLSLYGTFILFVLLGPIVAQGATYYVATTGNDSNSGTSTSPWRHPQRCAKSPIKAGDTCIVRSGTYTAPSSKPNVVVYITSTSAAGTSSQPITIKSEKQNGAVIVVPSTSSSLNAGFYLTRPYYIIQGFDITGGANNGSSVGFVGVSIQSSATGASVRSNIIHHIGRSVCSNSGYGFAGIYLAATSSVVVEENRIYSIGRRRNGESGCSTNKFQHDHGVYLRGGTNVTVRRNVFYDTSRGYPIHAYGGTVSNLNVYHNTLSGRSPTGKPTGQIMLSSTIKTAAIKNNISSDAQGGMVHAWSLSGSNISVHSNLSDTLVKSSSSVSWATFSNNRERTNPGFINKSSNDFRLTSSSAAINRGTTSGVPVVPDGAPDISAYEYSLQSNISSPLTPTGLGIQ
nr:right-handed parallel beta-helix repeat-containing protein [Nitrosomonas nitrosa]